MPSYYEKNTPTSANFPKLLVDGTLHKEQHLPEEGLYIGSLAGGSIDLPALFDLTQSKGLCLLYNNEGERQKVNRLLERLVWRLALTVPSNLCDLILYNGGNLGDAFNAHVRINKYLFDGRKEKIYFDGNQDEFKQVISNAYASIVDRMSTIRCAGKENLYQLNRTLGKDARLKYQFLILTDFPRHMQEETGNLISQIAAAGAKAGIYVIMSWDMNADFTDASGNTTFNPQQMMSSMEVIFPKDGRYYFKNTGHDDAFNRFNFTIDDTAMGAAECESVLQQIDIYAETAKKASKPSILKQDFDSIEKTPYEPVTSEISVTVGLDVTDKHSVTIKFNSGDYIHGFILGQSGSGKSVLLNNIITSAVLKYSPQDLMLYLMDFKGVEFNRYRGLKHTKAVLVDNSDPQMTLEVLRELRDENKRRVKLWQKEGVSNIDGYNRKYKDQRLPQVLFVADECQVMFKSSNTGTERQIQQEISEILNIIATQGRSQGIHMLLATQQLDETDISGQILKNLTECFLLMSAPGDSDKLVPDSSDLTSKQMTGLACYYHKKELQSQVQTFFATNEELEAAISDAQQKAKDISGNGEHYFCGSAMYSLTDHKSDIVTSTYDCPIALAGQNIGINAGATTLPLRDDFMENILIFGANKEEQSTGVLMNALASLILSFNIKGIACDFIVIDCLTMQNSRYKSVLSEWNSKGIIRLIPRQSSGQTLHDLVHDIQSGFARPTVLAIIGSEKYIEMKRKMPLLSANQEEEQSFDTSDGMEMLSISDISDLGGEDVSAVNLEDMTFPKALLYILEEGPSNGVHTILQVDKPQNILFEEYDMTAAEKFRHKIILKSENKFLQPFRFSQDIDVEVLSDEEEHLRAYYYPDGDDPVLFTPYQMPKSDVLSINEE